jgi:ABC-type anion transport system duplicated permease subunit
VRHIFSIGPWLMELFNPPLRDSLSIGQKMGRVILVTATLVTLSIIVALALALVCFAYEYGSNTLARVPHLARAVEILTCSIAVNFVSVMVLLQVKRVDQRLVPPVQPLKATPAPALKPTKK